MRLTCPNCGAQYEVPDEVIPETGRDVQCSNCGDTWFQMHPDHPQDPEDQLAEDDAEDAASRYPDEDEDDYGVEYDAEPDIPQDTDPQQDTDQPQDTDPQHDADDQQDDEGAWDDDPYPDAPQQDTGQTPRRTLDPSIRDLLREEAAREEQARAAEVGEPLESQPDLGLEDAGDTRKLEARARMARLRGLSDDNDDETPPAKDPIDPDSRRNLLPDIDEINSSFDAAPRRERSFSEADDLNAMSSGGGGFRRGFVWAVMVFSVLTLIYVFAPQIAGLSPALEGPMTAYVGLIDNLRAWLQSTVASLSG